MYVFDGDGGRDQRSLVKSQASNPYNIIYYTHHHHHHSPHMLHSNDSFINLLHSTLNTDELGRI